MSTKYEHEHDHHDHDHHDECGCGHDHHDHDHCCDDGCGCGHDHEHGGEVNKKEFWTKIIISGVFFYCRLHYQRGIYTARFAEICRNGMLCGFLSCCWL